VIPVDASVINDRELPVAFLDGRYILGAFFVKGVIDGGMG
jgi:hypothetical protein